MFDSPKTYLIFAALAAIITLIRALFAWQNTKREQEGHQSDRQQRQSHLESRLQAEGLTADESYASGCASLAYCRAQRVLVGVPDASEPFSLPLSEIKKIDLFDQSEKYQHDQEMMRLHRGVERRSVYLPYGKVKMREVRAGKESFEWYTGKPVYGVDITKKDGQVLSIACFRGDSSLFWVQEEDLTKLKRFVSTLQRALGQPN